MAGIGFTAFCVVFTLKLISFKQINSELYSIMEKYKVNVGILEASSGANPPITKNKSNKSSSKNLLEASSTNLGANPPTPKNKGHKNSFKK